MSIRCTACKDGVLGAKLFSIPDLPLVDSFCRTKEQAISVLRSTIILKQCISCMTIQIESPVDTSAIYKNYLYESSSSPDLQDHFRLYADCLKGQVQTDARILEVGANDGLLIKQLKLRGFEDITAIDPSPQAKEIDPKVAKVINDYFTVESTKSIKSKSIDLIIANNCFSHIPELENVLSLCSNLMTDKGLLVVEVQSTLSLIEGAVFDYIYHEHIFYHTITSFSNVAKGAGLVIHDVDFVNTKGGSYRIFLSKPGVRSVSGNVSYWRFREDIAGVHAEKAWLRLENYLAIVAAGISKFLSSSRGPIYGYGASATGTVLMRYFGIEAKIESIIDDNPKRQGLYAPGSGLKTGSLRFAKPNSSCLILAWRHGGIIAQRVGSRFERLFSPLPYPSYVIPPPFSD